MDFYLKFTGGCVGEVLHWQLSRHLPIHNVYMNIICLFTGEYSTIQTVKKKKDDFKLLFHLTTNFTFKDTKNWRKEMP